MLGRCSNASILNSNDLSTKPSDSWVDFGDGMKSLIDIDSIFPKETRTKVPDLGRLEKNCLTHTLNDFLDLSVQEYSASYISHSEAPFDYPFSHLKEEIEKALYFHEQTKELAFPQYNEVALGIYIILSKLFPPCLNKYLVESYEKKLDKYGFKKICEHKKVYDQVRTKEKARAANAN
jgi:hypothetical protein